MLDHVRPLQPVAQLAVVVARAHAADDGQLAAVVLVARNALRLLHEQRAVPLAPHTRESGMRIHSTVPATLAVPHKWDAHLVLVLGRIARVHGHGGAIHVQLAHHGAAPAQLGLPLCGAARHSAQAQQADQDVLRRVFIRKECFPAAVGRKVAPHQLHILGRYVPVNILPKWKRQPLDQTYLLHVYSTRMRLTLSVQMKCL